MGQVRHKHADLIIAWANGAQIEWYACGNNEWRDCIDNNPNWDEFTQYRVKTRWQKEKDAYNAGQKIQWRPTPIGTWRDMGDAEVPMWWENQNVEYRVKPHIHQELIDAHAKGAIIQWYSPTKKEWKDCEQNMPLWNAGGKYRIKPTVRNQEWLDAYRIGKAVQVILPPWGSHGNYVDVTPMEDNPEHLIWNSEFAKFRLKPHKHQKIIDAYNAGEFIQFRLSDKDEWWNAGYKASHGKELLNFHESYQYRVKPKNIVMQRKVVYQYNAVIHDVANEYNVRYTFDPDTHELLSVEKI